MDELREGEKGKVNETYKDAPGLFGETVRVSLMTQHTTARFEKVRDQYAFLTTQSEFQDRNVLGLLIKGNPLFDLDLLATTQTNSRRRMPS